MSTPTYDCDGNERPCWKRYEFSDGFVRFTEGERGMRRLVREEFPDGRVKSYNEDKPKGEWEVRHEIKKVRGRFVSGL